MATAMAAMNPMGAMAPHPMGYFPHFMQVGKTTFGGGFPLKIIVLRIFHHEIWGK